MRINPLVNAAPTLSISQPPGGGATVTVGQTYNITYTMADSDNVATAAFYYDTNNSGVDGTAISGACASAAEGTNATCGFNTTGVPAGTYYIYGLANDGVNAPVSAYSAGTLTITAGNLQVTNGTAVSGGNVKQGSTNNVQDSFAMAMSAAVGTVNTLTLTTSAGFTATNVSNVTVYNDAGTLGTLDIADTLIPTSYSLGAGTATITFTAPENVSTTKNYLIVVNISNTATIGASLTGRVTGAAGVNLGTPTYNDSASATLTIIAGTCTRSAPTVSLGADKGVTPGNSAVYTVTVTNNDTPFFCTDSTFALGKADVPSVPNTNFSASTLGSTTTGAMAGGASYSTTLTHTSTAGAASFSSLQTTVTATDSTNHAAQPGSDSATTLVNNNLLHNSATAASVGSIKNYWSGQGGWGIPNGVYGAFSCDTCHTKSTTNAKRIKPAISVLDTSKGNIPGGSNSPVDFKSTAGYTNGFGDDQNTHGTSTRICEVCHSQPAKHKYNQAASPLHENDQTTTPNYQDCVSCHEHKKGFVTPGCLDCHDKQQGSRAPVVGQFSGNSHHIQGKTLSNTDCYQCHWEANSNGSINYTYHLGWRNGLTGTSNSPVDLVIYGTTSRPTSYGVGTTAVQYTSSPASRTEYAKINTHCISCHDADSATAQPFGDGKTPVQYAWDSTSVGARYTQAGTTTWGKYTAGANTAPKDIAKAYSAHGNAAGNQLGWDNTLNGTGVDGAITDFTGGVSVLCFDCHNSHGSNVAGTTTSYASATANGGMLKDTTSGIGGYANTYRPQAGGSGTTKNTRNPGASICFDCHLNANAGAAPADATGTTTPWGYSVYGATRAIVGYQTTPYFGGGYNGQQTRYAFKQSKGNVNAGGHFGASSTMNTTPTGINGLCTPCHDPHGVTDNPAKIAVADKPYAVPLLKGTWLTSPYKEDAAPLATNEARGGGSKTTAFNVGSTPGHHIDQNTFQGAMSTNLTGYPRWDFSTSASTLMTQSVSQFGGLCVTCHSQTDINPTTTASTWKGMDRVHNTVKEWGGTGANASNAVHAYTCSKCHAPHNSQLPRMMITDCLDSKHRGRVASGGTVANYGPATNGTSGTGNGRYPGGGGGYSASKSGRPWKSNVGGAYFFGNVGTSRTVKPAFTNCHDAAPGNSGTWPTYELWNAQSPW